MRKSEVIKRISELLQDVRESKTADTLPVEDVCIYAAGFILEELENMGMQPPIHEGQHGSIKWTDLKWEEENVEL